MANFTISSGKDFLGLQAAPLRRDGTTPGTYSNLTWALSPNDGSLGTLTVPSTFAGNPNQDKANFAPAAGASGIATITVAGLDENGAPVASSITVAIVTDPNPTTSYVITQTH